jgi:hypothetical protein
MGTRLNMYCKNHLAGNEKYRENHDNVNWGPGHIQRDEFGFPILKNDNKKSRDSTKKKKKRRI